MERLLGNVLVVEDDKVCGLMMSHGLAAHGYGVRLAESRDDAVVAMKRYMYEYIILDYSMPGMSIDDFLVACKAVTANIVLVSAIVDPEVESKRQGISSWIRKPFTANQLVKVLQGLSLKA